MDEQKQEENREATKRFSEEFMAGKSLDADASTKTHLNSSQKLMTVIEVIHHVRGSNSIAEIMERTVEGVLKVFPLAEYGMLVLTQDHEIQPSTTLIRFQDGQSQGNVRDIEPILRVVTEKKSPYITNDGSIIAAPLLDHMAEPVGMILLERGNHKRKFSSEHAGVLHVAAAPIQFAIENQRLFDISLQEQKHQADLDAARAIQFSLLPDKPPVFDDYELFDYYAPAEEVGGDYFDYVLLNDNRIAILVGDVTGKGLPAALLMAKVSGQLATLLDLGVDADAALTHVDRWIFEEGPEAKFVTLVLAILDPGSHELKVFNVGHVPPVWQHIDGNVDNLGTEFSGSPLGATGEHGCKERSLVLERGESLILCTDGITEAQGAEAKLFGRERLELSIAELPSNAGAQVLGEHITETVNQFSIGEKQFDDICLVCLHRKA
ncbi:MAG: PP2C family protein-serine/threonine phosphatase [Pirellulales bacterium]|nr:PP2C family protein-serine/threonine phosphatase [Pirellulales bacterium]